jgi:hypothetical protein
MVGPPSAQPSVEFRNTEEPHGDWKRGREYEDTICRSQGEAKTWHIKFFF